MSPAIAGIACPIGTLSTPAIRGANAARLGTATSLLSAPVPTLTAPGRDATPGMGRGLGAAAFAFVVAVEREAPLAHAVMNVAAAKALAILVDPRRSTTARPVTGANAIGAIVNIVFGSPSAQSTRHSGGAGFGVPGGTRQAMPKFSCW